jgi:hypothetical protein
MAFYDEIGDKNFVISFTQDPRDDFGAFAEGYSHAASTLAESLLSKTGFPDSDAYPVVFLYRHSLELYLKNIIYKAALVMAFMDMARIDTALYTNHNLTVLSETATKILQTLLPQDASLRQFAKETMKISSEFSDIDAGSYSYRYPVDTKGRPSTRPNQVVSLGALHRTMSDFLEKMDTLDFGLQVATNQAQEIYEILNAL